MDANEVSDSGVRITSFSIESHTWGEKKDSYTGTMVYKVGETTISLAMDHEFCTIVLLNSLHELNTVIKHTGIDIIDKILGCKNPLIVRIKDNAAE